VKPQCNWCDKRLKEERVRAYCRDGYRLDYCSRECAETDTSAGPKFRGVRLRKVTVKT